MKKVPSEVESSNERKQNVEYLKEQFGRILLNIPIFIRCYYIITIVLFILNLKIKYISFYLINIPYYTIFKLQLWRLLTSVFITTNFLQILLAFFVWIKHTSFLETQLGTIKYALVFCINAISIQIINIIIMGGISLINNKIYSAEIKSKKNSGLWGILMCEMTMLCVSNPESQVKLLFLPFNIKAKIYPLILVLMFLVSNIFEVDIEIISGIIYGLIYYYFLKTKLQISDSFVQKLESLKIFKALLQVKGFISVNHISSGLPVSITNVSTVIEIENENLKEKGVVISGNIEKNVINEVENQKTPQNEVANNKEENTK